MAEDFLQTGEDVLYHLKLVLIAYFDQGDAKRSWRDVRLDLSTHPANKLEGERERVVSAVGIKQLLLLIIRNNILCCYVRS